MPRATLSCALVFMASAVSGWAGASKSRAEQAEAVNAVREYALNYTKRLPNYTCTLTTRQVKSPNNAGNKVVPVELTKVEEQLLFADGKEVRKVVRIDGRPASAEDAEQLRESTKGEFGNLLYAIFDPATGAELRWDRAATLNKRAVDAIAFRVPQLKGYGLNGSRGGIRVPFEGLVYADAETHAVLRLQMKCTMIPDAFEMQNVDLTLDYKSAQVAGHEVILPSHFVLHYRDSADDRQHADDGQYSAYHQFGANAAIQFDGETK